MENLSSFKTTRNGEGRLSWFFVILVVLVNAFLVLPNLNHIPPHPDEHQFYANAWSIMGGQKLQNFLHVATTEYALTAFLSAVNLLVPSGVNFPQGDPNIVTWFFGRVFGYLLYLAAFVLGSVLLQKGEKRLRIRTLIFAVLYFGSVGIFERFLRVNSDSMSIFIALNYLVFSLHFHKNRASLWRFFWLNLVFIFLLSFTNLKALYLGIPLLFINTFGAFFWYENDESGDPWKRLPKMYRFILYWLALAVGCVILWYALIPKPVNPKIFWYNIKNATVQGINYDFEYPTQSHNSWLVYLYDFFAEYLGLTNLILVSVLLALLIYPSGWRNVLMATIQPLRGQLDLNRLRRGELYRATEFLVLSIFLLYYFVVSRTMVHWSRWGVPLAFFGFLLLSNAIEKWVFILAEKKNNLSFFRPKVFLVAAIFSWLPLFVITYDLRQSDFPAGNGYKQTFRSINDFLVQKGIGKDEAQTRVAWFTGYTNNVGNLSLEMLAESKFSQVEYLLWPYWNIGPLYAPKVDRSTINQSEFVKKFGQEVFYRFPTLTSRYMHAVKYFAWRYLRLTWNPEIDTLVEPQYGVVVLKKDRPSVYSLDFEVGFKNLSHYYSSNSKIFNLNNLRDSYIFPTCYTSPEVKVFKTGQVVPPPTDPLVGSRTSGLYCHSLWVRVLLRGKYQIRIEGLSPQEEESALVYSTLPYEWDPASRTLTHGEEDTRISAEFGVATRQKNPGSLKFIVSHDLGPKTSP